MTTSRSNRAYPAVTALTLAGLGAAVAFNFPALAGTGSVATAATKTTTKTTRTTIKTAARTSKTAAKTKKTAASKATTTTRLAVASNSATPSGTPPNVIFVMADDLGVDASPCYPAYGAVKPKMPNVEKLCADGVVFDNMTASPLCSPSRAAALTGKYGFRTNVGNVDVELSAEETTVLDVVTTAPTPYANAVIGKWHLGGPQADPTQPERLGAQYFDGFLRGTVPDFFSWPRVIQGQTNTSSIYTTTALTDSAVAWTGKQTKPWLLWLAYNAPHTPFHLPPANLLSNSTLSGAATDITQNPQAYYMASLEALDTELGRLLHSLPTAVRANTVVMFMGDNGTPARVIQAPFTTATAKGSVTEGGVHVPLIVAGAGVTEKGKRSAALLNGVDIFPTIAELARTKAPGQIDGLSFAGQFTNTAAVGPRTFAYSELFSNPATPETAATPTATAAGAAGAGVAQRRRAAAGAGPAAGAGGVGAGGASDTNLWAVRDTRYKLVHNVTTGAEQLFDLQTDPAEATPLPASGSPTDIASKLKAIVTRLRG